MPNYEEKDINPDLELKDLAKELNNAAESFLKPTNPTSTDPLTLEELAKELSNSKADKLIAFSKKENNLNSKDYLKRCEELEAILLAASGVFAPREGQEASRLATLCKHLPDDPSQHKDTFVSIDLLMLQAAWNLIQDFKKHIHLAPAAGFYGVWERMKRWFSPEKFNGNNQLTREGTGQEGCAEHFVKVLIPNIATLLTGKIPANTISRASTDTPDKILAESSNTVLANAAALANAHYAQQAEGIFQDVAQTQLNMEKAYHRKEERKKSFFKSLIAPFLEIGNYFAYVFRRNRGTYLTHGKKVDDPADASQAPRPKYASNKNMRKLIQHFCQLDYGCFENLLNAVAIPSPVTPPPDEAATNNNATTHSDTKEQATSSERYRLHKRFTSKLGTLNYSQRFDLMQLLYENFDKIKANFAERLQQHDIDVLNILWDKYQHSRREHHHSSAANENDQALRFNLKDREVFKDFYFHLIYSPASYQLWPEFQAHLAELTAQLKLRETTRPSSPTQTSTFGRTYKKITQSVSQKLATRKKEKLIAEGQKLKNAILETLTKEGQDEYTPFKGAYETLINALQNPSPVDKNTIDNALEEISKIAPPPKFFQPRLVRDIGYHLRNDRAAHISQMQTELESLKKDIHAVAHDLGMPAQIVSVKNYLELNNTAGNLDDTQITEKKNQRRIKYNLAQSVIVSPNEGMSAALSLFNSDNLQTFQVIIQKASARLTQQINRRQSKESSDWEKIKQGTIDKAGNIANLDLCKTTTFSTQEVDWLTKVLDRNNREDLSAKLRHPDVRHFQTNPEQSFVKHAMLLKYQVQGIGPNGELVEEKAARPETPPRTPHGRASARSTTGQSPTPTPTPRAYRVSFLSNARKRRRRKFRHLIKGRSKKIAFGAATGEGLVAAWQAKGFFRMIPHIAAIGGAAVASLMTVFIGGLACNFLLLYPSVYKQYLRWKYKEFWLDKDKKEITGWGKKALLYGFLALCLATGIVFFCLSFNDVKGFLLDSFFNLGALGKAGLGIGYALALIPATVTGITIFCLLFATIKDFIDHKRWRGIADYFQKTYACWPKNGSALEIVNYLVNAFSNALKLVIALGFTLFFSFVSAGFLHTNMMNTLHKIATTPLSIASIAGYVCASINGVAWIPLNISLMTTVLSSINLNNILKLAGGLIGLALFIPSAIVSRFFVNPKPVHPLGDEPSLGAKIAFHCLWMADRLLYIVKRISGPRTYAEVDEKLAHLNKLRTLRLKQEDRASGPNRDASKGIRNYAQAFEKISYFGTLIAIMFGNAANAGGQGFLAMNGGAHFTAFLPGSFQMTVNGGQSGVLNADAVLAHWQEKSIPPSLLESLKNKRDAEIYAQHRTTTSDYQEMLQLFNAGHLYNRHKKRHALHEKFEALHSSRSTNGLELPSVDEGQEDHAKNANDISTPSQTDNHTNNKKTNSPSPVEMRSRNTPSSARDGRCSSRLSVSEDLEKSYTPSQILKYDTYLTYTEKQAATLADSMARTLLWQNRDKGTNRVKLQTQGQQDLIDSTALYSPCGHHPLAQNGDTSLKATS